MFDWPVLKQYDEAHIARIALPLGPFPYHNEVMTGFEYTAAVGMIQEGMEPEGLRLVQAIRDRYDGAKRSPFDEAECGHHYARAMTSWSLPLALTGFHYDALAGEMRFRAADGPVSWFWSTGNAWGVCCQKAGEVELQVLHGSLALERVTLTGVGTLDFGERTMLTAGSVRSGRVSA